MKTEDYLAKLADAKNQGAIGKLMGLALMDRECKPEAYTVLCNIALDKGFKFKNIQLP